MSVAATTASCLTCGVSDFGTRFCENCGTEMVRAAPAIASVSSPFSTAPGKPGLPVVFLFAGLVGPAIVGAVSGLLTLSPISASFSRPFEAVILLLALLLPVSVILAGRASRATMGARVAGLLIALMGTAIELFFLVVSSGMAYYFGAMDAVPRLIFLVGTVLVVLAWLVATGSPASAYRVVWLAAAVALVYFLVTSLVPISSEAAFVWRSIVASFILYGGLMGVILLIPRFIRPLAQSDGWGVGGGSGAALPLRDSTNGFAVTALILGLLGGMILPVVFGHIALAQIGRTGDRGRGMAIAGLVLGYLSVAVVIVIAIVVLVSVANSRGSY